MIARAVPVPPRRAVPLSDARNEQKQREERRLSNDKSTRQDNTSNASVSILAEFISWTKLILLNIKRKYLKC